MGQLRLTGPWQFLCLHEAIKEVNVSWPIWWDICQACIWSFLWWRTQMGLTCWIKLSKITDFISSLQQEQVFHIDSKTESGKGRCSFNPQVNTISVMLSRCLLPPLSWVRNHTNTWSLIDGSTVKGLSTLRIYQDRWISAVPRRVRIS